MTDSVAILDALRASLPTGASVDRRIVDAALGELDRLAASLAVDGFEDHSAITRDFLDSSVAKFHASEFGEDRILAAIHEYLAELAPRISQRKGGVPPAPRRSVAKSKSGENAPRTNGSKNGSSKKASSREPKKPTAAPAEVPAAPDLAEMQPAPTSPPPAATLPPSTSPAPVTATPAEPPSQLAGAESAFAPSPDEVSGAAAIAFDAELLAGFCAEAFEHLERAESHLLILEKNPRLQESLDGLFRSFHTIKGAAGFLALSHVVGVAHEAENVLVLARNGDLELRGEAVDLVLSSVDVLKRQVTLLTRDEGREESPADRAARSHLVERLSVLAAGTRARSAAGPVRNLPLASAAGESVVSPADVSTSDAAAIAAKESVKVDRDRLDRLIDLIGELVISESMVRQNLLSAAVDATCGRNLAQLDKITRHLQELSLSLRMVPVRATFQKMSRLVRDLGRKLDKQIELELSGEETELDKTLVDQIGDPLMHMIRNSVDHGIEPTAEERTAAGKPACGRIALRAFHQGGNICIEIEDDGRGLNRDRILAKARERGLVAEDKTPADDEILQLIFRPGFSTAAQVTDVSGRGVGMDVVRRNVEAMRGSIDLRSDQGRGTCFTIRLPLTLAIIDGMVVRVERERYVVPMLAIIELLRPRAGDVGTVAGRAEYFSLRGRRLPLIRMRRVLSACEPSDDARPHDMQLPSPEEGIIVVVEEGNRLVGLLVDEVLGQQQAVIKSLGSGLHDQPGVSGGAVMPDGRVGLILDVHGLIDLAAESA
jgi:two-component system chemotaxis sensor kinase CheA